MDRGRAEIDGEASEETPPTKRIKTERRANESVIRSIELPREHIFVSAQISASTYTRASPSPLSVSSLLNPIIPPIGQTTPSIDEDAAGTHRFSPLEKYAVASAYQPGRASSLDFSVITVPSENLQASVDLSSAPSDPEELAVWVAEQIDSFASGRASNALTETEKSRRSLSHAPGARARDKNDKGLSQAALDAKDRAREVGRLRKAKWRKKNAGANADNDLNCRVSKRAKEIYGEHSSDEKTEFLNAEFKKRKGKHKVKGRITSEARFPGFDVPADLGAKLFTSGNDEVGREVDAAGILLINTLYGVTFADKPPSNQNAAHALKSALDDPEVDNQLFVEALRVLSADPGIMSAIAPSRASSKSSSKNSSRAASTAPASMAPASTNLVTHTPNHNSDHAPVPVFRGGRTFYGADSSAFPAAQQVRLRGGLAMDTDELSEKDRQLQAINTAIEILIQMTPDNPAARFPAPGAAYPSPYQTHYQTPYPNKGPETHQATITKGVNVQTAPSPLGPNGSGVPNSFITPQLRARQETKAVTNFNGSKKPTPSEEAQADLLLHFAGLGSVASSDGGKDTAGGYGNSKPQPDAEVEILLQHVCRVLEGRDVIAGTSQARAFRSAMNDVGVNKNVVIPKEQGQAISRLYTHLANRAKELPMLGAAPTPFFPNGGLFQYPGGPGFHRPGNIVPVHPGGAFLDQNGRVLPYPPGPMLVAHPGGVFTSPQYPGGYFVPQPSGFLPQPRGFLPPHPVPYGHGVLPTHGSGSRADPIVFSDPTARPQEKPFVPANMPPPPIPTRISTARGKTAEEARKVRAYGFPPLPGSRPGENAPSMKKKAGE